MSSASFDKSQGCSKEKMSSERYDEAVREQKKAERKKQVQKQVMILVIALVLICSCSAAVFFTVKGKKASKRYNEASSSGLAVRSVQVMRHLLLRQIRMRLRKT